MMNKILRIQGCQNNKVMQLRERKENWRRLNKDNKKKQIKCWNMKEGCKKLDRGMRRNKENRWRNK